MVQPGRIIVVFDQPPPFGGVRVLASLTFDYLKEQSDLEYIKLPFDTNKARLPIALWRFFRMLLTADGVLFQFGNILAALRRRNLLYFGTALLTKRRIFYRGFAGGLKSQYKGLSPIKRQVLKRALSKCTLVTFETVSDYEYFSDELTLERGTVEWLPNYRPLNTSPPKHEQSDEMKLCFLGKISPEKGVDSLLDAEHHLPAGVTIDLYGPVEDRDNIADRIRKLPSTSSIRYRGTVQADEAAALLSHYDWLILPTKWKTEGHPGVILEALSVGVPVIATKWNGIPDILDESCGILMETNDVTEIVVAIQKAKLAKALKVNLQIAAYQRARQYGANEWTDKLHHWIKRSMANDLSRTD
jgi:glycosyltransferase involved in cell wall biosynthesis